MSAADRIAPRFLAEPVKTGGGMDRVRIRTMPTPDGSIPSGMDVEVVAIRVDGAEVPIIARRVTIEIDDSGNPVKATIEVVNIEFAVEAKVAS